MAVALMAVGHLAVSIKFLMVQQLNILKCPRVLIWIKAQWQRLLWRFEGKIVELEPVVWIFFGVFFNVKGVYEKT